MADQIDKKLIQSEKKMIKDTIDAYPMFRSWTVQFHKTYYTIRVLRDLSYIRVNCFGDLTDDEQERFDGLMKALALHYPVKILGQK